MLLKEKVMFLELGKALNDAKWQIFVIVKKI